MIKLLDIYQQKLLNRYKVNESDEEQDNDWEERFILIRISHKMADLCWRFDLVF